jgi:HD-GYP domain-containing protein (c-di-GMP phosphodiesterase class II)
MLLASVKSLKPQMKLAQPILHPRRDDIILLEKGYELDGEIIARLLELEIPYVWIEFPDLDEIDGHINTEICSQHMSLYGALRDAMLRVQGRVAVEMNYSLYRRSIDAILQEIVKDPDHEVLTTQLAMCAPELSGHLANCCYLSLLLGAHLSGYLRQQRRTLPATVAEDTSRLGLGALLHDIGKLDMPEDVRHVHVLDERSEWPEYQAHCQVGYEMVSGHVPPLAANVVRQHHQRWDGTGFPARRDRCTNELREPYRGDQIHIFARIVAVVDAFDHLTWQNGRMVPTIVALHEIASGRFAGWFDPVVLDTLGRLVPPFMVGSVVRLSEGSNAVLVANHQDEPCRPSVRLLSGSIYQRGTRVQGKPIDLRLHRKLFIASVDGFDVTKYLFEGPLAPGVSAAHLPRRLDTADSTP